MRFFALVPAAGNGVRFASERPKQYAALAGKTVLAHTIERLHAGLPCTRTLVLLAPGDRWFEQVIGEKPGVTPLRCGGRTRAETVAHGLDALASLATNDDWVIVHDAVRACVDLASLERLRSALAHDPVGGLLAVPLACTIKRDDGEMHVARTEPRERLWCAQTPQMFRFGVLRRAFAQPDIARFTDEAQAVEALGLHPRLVEGSSTNLKVTFPEDLLLAAAILRLQADAKD